MAPRGCGNYASSEGAWNQIGIKTRNVYFSPCPQLSVAGIPVRVEPRLFGFLMMQVCIRRSLLTSPRIVTLRPNPSLTTSRRLLYTSEPLRSSNKHPIRSLRRALLWTGAISGSMIVGIWADAKTCPEPPFKVSTSSSPRGATATPSIPTRSSDLLPLLRAYLVYGLISVPFLVDYAPALLDHLLCVPVLGSIVKSFVRGTFFTHVRCLY